MFFVLLLALQLHLECGLGLLSQFSKTSNENFVYRLIHCTQNSEKNWHIKIQSFGYIFLNSKRINKQSNNPQVFSHVNPITTRNTRLNVGETEKLFHPNSHFNKLILLDEATRCQECTHVDSVLKEHRRQC